MKSKWIRLWAELGLSLTGISLAVYGDLSSGPDPRIGVGLALLGLTLAFVDQFIQRHDAESKLDDREYRETQKREIKAMLKGLLAETIYFSRNETFYTSTIMWRNKVEGFLKSEFQDWVCQEFLTAEGHHSLEQIRGSPDLTGNNWMSILNMRLDLHRNYLNGLSQEIKEEDLRFSGAVK